MPLHGRNQERNERLEALPANPVRYLPKNHEGLSHGLVIDPTCGTGPRPVYDMVVPEKPLRMFSVMSGNLREFRQDAAHLRSRRSPVSRRHCLQKFVSRSHADPPHVCPRPEPLRERF